MKGHSLPGPNQRKDTEYGKLSSGKITTNFRRSPAKKAGIYETTFVDGVESNKRITREQAEKSEKMITETGKDISLNKFDSSLPGNEELAKQNVQILKDRKARKVKDLETGEMISSKEDQEKQKKTKSPAKQNQKVLQKREIPKAEHQKSTIPTELQTSVKAKASTAKERRIGIHPKPSY